MDRGNIHKHTRLPPQFIGLNTVESAQPSILRDFVDLRGGHTVISKILIANNGIAAVKEMRSIRKWAYETFNDEKIIQFVVMATPDDLHANSSILEWQTNMCRYQGYQQQQLRQHRLNTGRGGANGCGCGLGWMGPCF